MTSPAPAVSIVIRTHNAEAYLPALLQSLRKQTFTDWEIVAVIHKCTDRSEEILKAAGARIIYYPAADSFNYSRALNIGAEAAKGEFLLNLSSHVEFVREDTLEKMVGVIRSEELAAVTVMRRFAGERYSKQEKLAYTTSENFRGSGGLANFCGLIPRALWKKHAFGESIPTVEDSAWAAYWISRGCRTAWLGGHAVIYKNPRFSVEKLVRERCVIALFLSSDCASTTFARLSTWTRKNAKRYLRSRDPRLWRCVAVEFIASWQLRRLSRSTEKQESIRLKMVHENPGLDEYIKKYVRPEAPENEKAQNAEKLKR
jgi:glycosyltransferase involved in cell wall biosynthesis